MKFILNEGFTLNEKYILEERYFLMEDDANNQTTDDLKVFIDTINTIAPMIEDGIIGYSEFLEELKKTNPLFKQRYSGLKNTIGQIKQNFENSINSNDINNKYTGIKQAITEIIKEYEEFLKICEPNIPTETVKVNNLTFNIKTLENKINELKKEVNSKKFSPKTVSSFTVTVTMLLSLIPYIEKTVDEAIVETSKGNATEIIKKIYNNINWIEKVIKKVPKNLKSGLISNWNKKYSSAGTIKIKAEEFKQEVKQLDQIIDIVKGVHFPTTRIKRITNNIESQGNYLLSDLNETVEVLQEILEDRKVAKQADKDREEAKPKPNRQVSGIDQLGIKSQMPDKPDWELCFARIKEGKHPFNGSKPLARNVNANTMSIAERDIWDAYYTKEWGENAKHAEELGQAFKQELLALGFNQERNPFITFVRSLFKRDIFLGDATYAHIHNLYLRNIISENELRGNEDDNILLFNKSLYESNYSDIPEYLAMYKTVRSPEFSEIKVRTIKERYTRDGIVDSSFYRDLFFEPGIIKSDKIHRGNTDSPLRGKIEIYRDVDFAFKTKIEDEVEAVLSAKQNEKTFSDVSVSKDNVRTFVNTENIKDRATMRDVLLALLKNNKNINPREDIFRQVSNEFGIQSSDVEEVSDNTVSQWKTRFAKYIGQKVSPGYTVNENTIGLLLNKFKDVLNKNQKKG